MDGATYYPRFWRKGWVACMVHELGLYDKKSSEELEAARREAMLKPISRRGLGFRRTRLWSTGGGVG